MDPTFMTAVFNTQNIALLLAVIACIAVWKSLWTARKEDAAERHARDLQTSLERATLYELVRQNTSAIHDLRNTLSAINGKVI